VKPSLCPLWFRAGLRSGQPELTNSQIARRRRSAPSPSHFRRQMPATVAFRGTLNVCGKAAYQATARSQSGPSLSSAEPGSGALRRTIARHDRRAGYFIGQPSPRESTTSPRSRHPSTPHLPEQPPEPQRVRETGNPAKGPDGAHRPPLSQSARTDDQRSTRYVFSSIFNSQR
jgi:hypothetical protein